MIVATAASSQRADQFGDALRGLTQAQRTAFQAGLDEFSEAEEVEDGLGPVFNDRSCAVCHSVPAVGGGSERTVTRFGKTTNGAFDPLAQFGGSLIQENSIGPADLAGIHQFQAETVPASATIVVHRRTTPLFGLGLVDAVPDADFFALAAKEAQQGDGTAGRVSMVADLVHGGQSVGKFGWKAQVPNLMQFSADAYLNEMGITSPLFPNENCPNGNCGELSFNPAPGLNDAGDGVQKFADFMTLLAPPARVNNTRDRTGNAGEQTFEQAGCTACHTATMRTGSSNIAALDRQTFHPYSDFLLHDMGSLGDGITQGAAGGREMRTTPLWGLRAVTRYLHDGRATTLEAAILAHDGQGKAARDRFSRLDARRKASLLAFLNSL
jgi:CxxC motif-containing protein (DUF1111 family)